MWRELTTKNAIHLHGEKYVDTRTLHSYAMVEHVIPKPSPAITASTFLVSGFPPDVTQYTNGIHCMYHYLKPTSKILLLQPLLHL